MAWIFIGLLFLQTYYGCFAANSVFYRSCKEIKSAHPSLQSGSYYITTATGNLEVYCEMAINGGGYTFLPKSATSSLTQHDLAALYTEHDHVLLRIKKNNGKQTYTVIRQHHQYQNHPISIQLNSHEGYAPFLNKNLGPYIYVGLLPISIAGANTVQGLKTNGIEISFRNCDKNPNAYFVFCANKNEAKPSPYHSQNLIYEKQGFAISWRKSARPIYSLHYIPEEYFFFTEVHFGGCGTYTSSDRWVEAMGTAIGFR